LPKAVEEYAHRSVTLGINVTSSLDFASFCSVSPAVASNYSRAGVVVNFVTATGGDVEMLRSIECFYK
jgi:translation initiation factor 4A